VKPGSPFIVTSRIPRKKKGICEILSTAAAAVSFGWKGCGRRGGEISFDKSSFYFVFFLKQGVCHTVTSPFTLKSILKGKRRIMEIQIFQQAKI